MTALKPFQNDSQSTDIAGLTIENRLDRLVLYGNAELTRDQCGLRNALQLRTLLDEVVQALQAAGELPEQITVSDPVQTVANPFA